MKITVIGSNLCQDTMNAIAALDAGKADYEFKNISADLANLKAFCKLRESNPLYEAVRANDGLGIPFFRLEDGTETLDVEEVLRRL